MSDASRRLYNSVNNMLNGLKLMSDRRPDAKIGTAATTFNAVLRATKQELRSSGLIQEVRELSDHDTVVALVAGLAVLQAELGDTMYG